MNRSREILERLPVFPLTGVFLFPGVVTPLHIFERRYVDMTEDALEGDKLIAVATPDRETPPIEEGKPAIRQIAGVGKISKHERLPDGRYNIWLTAIGRVEIEEELATTSRYRVVRAHWLPSVNGDPRETVLAEEVRKLIRALISSGDNALNPLTVLIDSQVDPVLMSDALPSLLLAEPQEQQKMLEELSAVARLEHCIEALKVRLLLMTDRSTPN